MPTIKLEDPTISVEHTDGKVYTLADPIAFILDLMGKGLVDANGAASNAPATVQALRDETCKAFGFPSLTCAQVMQVMEAITAFAESLQKKTPTSPTLPNATASSPRKMPVG